jgi:threonine/homoserine/homoserine lactone efflux protein
MPDYFLFLLASLAITIAPGPDNLQVLARGISQGRAAGVAAAGGFAAGVIFHTTLAALGVAALIKSSPLAFETVKIAGALYLIWIGFRALRSRGLGAAQAGAPARLRTVFWQSVLGNMLNPKVTLFFIVFLPQFVDTTSGRSAMLQMFSLGAVFMLQAFVVFSAFGLGAAWIGAWLKRRPRAGVWLDRLAGVTFIVLGLRVALVA